MKHNKEYFIKVCNESLSMAQAASKLGMHFNTFKKYAVEFGCYCPNQSGKGISKQRDTVIPLDVIISGDYPSYQTNKLKKRLIKEGVLENKCAWCGLSEKWNNKPIVLELNHIDGNKYNHRLDNLQILCPNCHSQTATFRGKNASKI